MAYVFQIKTPNGVTYDLRDETSMKDPHTAGFHNSIYRGNNLGSTFTQKQATEISSGTFDDLYVGDYWISNVYQFPAKLIILGFDYFYNRGDTPVTNHHVVVGVPHGGGSTISASNTNSGYYGIKSAVNTVRFNNHINEVFGSCMSWRDSYSTAASNGIPSAGSWYDSQGWDFLTENQVFGSKIVSKMNTGTTSSWNYSLSCTQFPYFSYTMEYCGMYNFFGFRSSDIPNIFLRDLANSTQLCAVSRDCRPIATNVANGGKTLMYTCICMGKWG